MTVIDRTQRFPRPLGYMWLVLGVPIGGLIGWLAQMSDHAADRHFGTFLLVLALLSLVLGVGLLRSSRSGLVVASLVLSAAWVAAAAIVLVGADFIADKAWGAGLTGLVAVATVLVAVLVTPTRAGSARGRTGSR